MTDPTRIQVAVPDIPKPIAAEPSTATSTADVIRVESPKPLAPELVDRWWYWCGVLPHAPFTGAHTGTVSWQRESMVFRWSGHSHRKEGVRMLGMLHLLSRADLETIAQRLARQIVRPVRAASFEPRLPGVENVGDSPRDVGQVVTLPTPQELEEFAQNYRIRRRPSAHLQPGDEPLAQFVYCVPCNEDQPHPRPIGTPLPLSVAETGIALATSAPVSHGARTAWDEGRRKVHPSVSA